MGGTLCLFGVFGCGLWDAAGQELADCLCKQTSLLLEGECKVGDFVGVIWPSLWPHDK